MDNLNHPIFVIVLYWVFSALVGSMETPTMSSNGWYKFAFRFLHSIAGNINRAAITFSVPGSNGSPDGKQ